MCACVRACVWCVLCVCCVRACVVCVCVVCACVRACVRVVCVCVCVCVCGVCPAVRHDGCCLHAEVDVEINLQNKCLHLICHLYSYSQSLRYACGSRMNHWNGFKTIHWCTSTQSSKYNIRLHRRHCQSLYSQKSTSKSLEPDGWKW